MERQRQRNNILLFLMAFCALVAACLVAANQVHVPFLSFESVVQRFNEEASPAFAQGIPNCRFHSCSGGATACHTRGNLAGFCPNTR